MKYTHLLLFVFALFLTSNAYGQKYLDKSYKEWTVEETNKILSAAPWADEYQSERGLIAAENVQQSIDRSNNSISGANRGNQGRASVPVPIVIRLHSALPIRQAMVRQQQIGAKYDKMSDDEKKKFDESTAKFLECAICKGYYVVTITKWRDTSDFVTDGIFQSLTFDDLKGKVWLVNDKDEKLELAQFTPPKKSTDSAVFFFKRPAGEEPAFITPTDKRLLFMFANELRDNKNAYSSLIPRSFEFKISKMLSPDGTIQF